MGIFDFFGNILGSKKASSCDSCDGNAVKDLDKALDLTNEDVTVVKNLDERIVVGKILEITAHPDPKVTKVRVTQTEIAPGVTEQILCGGSNIAVGMVVPVATIGTDMGEGFIIGERAIRGTVSRGMICARTELGLTPNEEKKGEIWPLPEKFEAYLGKKFKNLFS